MNAFGQPPRPIYSPEAYKFVFGALRYSQQTIGRGVGPEDGEPDEDAHTGGGQLIASRHLTGPQLLAGLREYAHNEYGPLARDVFADWNVRTTRDFGEVVFDLIKQGEMRATADDRVEDFDDVFDFETDLVENYRVDTSQAFE